jgi:hypothetical protein
MTPRKHQHPRDQSRSSRVAVHLCSTEAMAAVHWDTKNLSPSFLHSPTLDGSTESYISTSSLEYLNSQLVAHGYAPSPGLSLDGLSGTDSDRVVKCLLGMLSQRMVRRTFIQPFISSSSFAGRYVENRRALHKVPHPDLRPRTSPHNAPHRK